jgi:hypothetical protein
MLEGTLKLPISCSLIPAFMIPEEARLGAFTLTTGERDGRTCTVTDAWDDLLRVTSMIDKVIMH